MANQTYNARDWLNGDTYSPNGSTLQGGTGVSPADSFTDTYDFEERLILRTKTDGTTINLLYDADGHRVAKNILNAAAQPVSSTNWLVDTNNLTGYAQVFEERITTASPTPTTTVRLYTYGSDLISQAATTGGATTLRYFIYDGHGSTRELTDATGAVTDRYDYDAFRNLVFLSGTTASAYRYCGEQYDPDLGLYYNRARYLNTDSGRFWSQDSYEGSRQDPMSLHKYLYANTDPVKYKDPSGHLSMAEMQMTVAAVGTLARIAAPSIARFGVKMVHLVAAHTLRKFFVLVGSIPLATQMGQKLSAWDKFQRFFITPTQSYPGVANWVRELFQQAGTTANQHHVFIQQAWYCAGSRINGIRATLRQTLECSDSAMQGLTFLRFQRD